MKRFPHAELMTSLGHHELTRATMGLLHPKKAAGSYTLEAATKITAANRMTCQNHQKLAAAGSKFLENDVKLLRATKLVPLKIRRQMHRVPWSDEDLNILWQAFKHCKKAPNAAAINACVRDNPSLSSRTLPQIKTRAWALITKRKNIKKAGFQVCRCCMPTCIFLCLIIHRL